MTLQDRVEYFYLRATLRARLVIAGELEFIPAVDELHGIAVRSGIVDEIGIDARQRVLAAGFADVRRVFSGTAP
jgi:hypothetical protein